MKNPLRNKNASIIIFFLMQPRFHYFIPSHLSIHAELNDNKSTQNNVAVMLRALS